MLLRILIVVNCLIDNVVVKFAVQGNGTTNEVEAGLTLLILGHIGESFEWRIIDFVVVLHLLELPISVIYLSTSSALLHVKYLSLIDDGVLAFCLLTGALIDILVEVGALIELINLLIGGNCGCINWLVIFEGRRGTVRLLIDLFVRLLLVVQEFRTQLRKLL